MKRLVAGTVVLLALTVACRAADLSITTTSKAGQIGNYDWAGAYVGAEFGYAAERETELFLAGRLRAAQPSSLQSGALGQRHVGQAFCHRCSRFAAGHAVAFGPRG